MTNEDLDREKLKRLRKLLIEHFTLGELELLCFDLDVDFEDLGGGSKSMVAQNLITYMVRRGKVQRLIEEAIKQRPEVAWPGSSTSIEGSTEEEPTQRELASSEQEGGNNIEQQINTGGGTVFTGGISADRDVFGGDQIIQGDVNLGKDLREEQFDIALNWDRKRRMRGYDLAGRDLSGLNLANSDLRKANLQGADLSDSVLSEADMTGAKLRGAKLTRTDLSRAVLSGADLEDANLWRAKLIEAQLLERTNLLHANLAEANLFKVKISAGILHGAILKGATLREAIVMADLSHADLSAAELQGADLSKVENLWEVISIVGATYDGDTKWPAGFDPKTAGAVLVDEDNGPEAEVSEEDTGSYTDAKTGLEMIPIPAGEFLYGEDNRLDYLPDYWIAKTPVTNGHYFRFIRETGHEPPAHWEGESPRAEIADHPVVHVSYADAVAYAEWAGLALPGEKEWEKAARGTDGRIYPWGNAWVEGNCNTKESGIGTTTPAGHFSPQGDSPYGCVDMTGNVYDWTPAWFDEEEEWRVLRGGSWEFDQDIARATTRDGTPQTDRINDIGFRVVRRSG